MQLLTVLLNAHAGHAAAGDPGMVARVGDAFAAAGCQAKIQLTDGTRIAADCEKALADRSAVVVAAGGDGTVSSVASALAGTSVPLGVLPMGTLNHFAKDLGLPLDLDAAAAVIAAGHAMAVDVGEVNGHAFINNSSVGLYATLVAEREVRQRDGRTKWIAHGLAAAQVWSRYRRLHVKVRARDVDTGGDANRNHADVGSGDVRVAERRVRTPFVFVGNNEYQLNGFELGGRRSLTRGRLQICMAPEMTRWGVARMIAAAVFGRIHAIEEFESLGASACTLDTGAGRMRVSLDGEVVVMENPLTYRIRPAALRVIVPADPAGAAGTGDHDPARTFQVREKG